MASAPVLVGCFSSSEPLTNQGTYKYQSSGHCSGICTSRNEGVVGLSDGNVCWCGDELPALDTKVLDARCNTPCQGYGIEDCGGGDFYFTIWLTGLDDNVPYYNPNTTSPSSTVVSVSGTATNTAKHEPTSTFTQTPQSSKPHHDLSDKSIAIIIGVVIGLVALLVLALILCCLRRRKKRTGTLRRKPSTLLSFTSRPSSWASIAPDARISIVAGSRKWEGRISSTPRRSQQPVIPEEQVAPYVSEENPFYTPEERQSFNRLRADDASSRYATDEAVTGEDHEPQQPAMSEYNNRQRGSPLPTVLFPGHRRTSEMPTSHQVDLQAMYQPPQDEQSDDVISPMAEVPARPFGGPRRPPPMVHYPSWSEVSEFDFAANNNVSSERKAAPVWHPWRERRDGRYELA